VQTWREGEFPRRMYVYNYRIFDRYDREAVSLADDDPSWRPDHFEHGRWGFRAGIQFPIVKLLDHAPHWQQLEADPNPFAVVVLAHLKTLETRRDPGERQSWKVRLVKGLYERGLSAEDVRQLFRFIDWVMDLPRSLSKLFWQEITEFQEERRMPFMTTPERLGLEKGLLEAIELLLQVKFGQEGLALLPEIRELPDVEQTRAVLRALATATTLDEVWRVWKQ
jgi:hypothetical protein